jgi:hypothetical protein
MTTQHVSHVECPCCRSLTTQSYNKPRTEPRGLVSSPSVLPPARELASAGDGHTGCATRRDAKHWSCGSRCISSKVWICRTTNWKRCQGGFFFFLESEELGFGVGDRRWWIHECGVAEQFCRCRLIAFL